MESEKGNEFTGEMGEIGMGWKHGEKSMGNVHLHLFSEAWVWVGFRVAPLGARLGCFQMAFTTPVGVFIALRTV